MVCLPSKDAKRVPGTAAEREILVAAGLREKRVTIPNLNCSWEEFKAEILASFPVLSGCGGFELLRCVPNSKDLEIIKVSVAQSPSLLKQMIGNARVFIRPIQKDINLDDLLASISQVIFHTHLYRYHMAGNIGVERSLRRQILIRQYNFIV